MDARLTGNRICFTGYDFRGSSVHPAGAVTAGMLRDADWNSAPPEVRTTRGETLFVPAGQAAGLKEFCRHHGIPERRRPDIWADLLELFLYTRHSAEHDRATLARLRGAGVPPAVVAQIRRHVAPLMRAYNIDSTLWDWSHLGLYDLLSAAAGELVPAGLPARLGDLAAFYWWAMDVADGRVTRPS